MGGGVKIKATGAGADRAGGGWRNRRWGQTRRRHYPICAEVCTAELLAAPALAGLAVHGAIHRRVLALAVPAIAALAPLPATTTAVSKFERKNG